MAVSTLYKNNRVAYSTPGNGLLIILDGMYNQALALLIPNCTLIHPINYISSTSIISAKSGRVVSELCRVYTMLSGDLNALIGLVGGHMISTKFSVSTYIYTCTVQ